MALTKISTAMISQDAASVDLNIDAGTLYIDSTNNRVGVANTSPATALDVTGTITADNIKLGDNQRVQIGDGQDFQFYHDGSNSYILATGGSGSLITRADVFGVQDSSNINMIEAASTTGVVTLYYNTGFTSAARLATSSTGVSITGNLTTTGYIAGPATFTIDPAAVGDNTGTVVIAGNLQVDGTTTTINSTTMTVDDLNITLASGAANAAAANGAGITVDGASATITYDGTNDEWDFNKDINVTGTLTASGADFGGTVTADGLTVDGTATIDGASGIPLTLDADAGANTNLQFSENGSLRWYLRSVTSSNDFNFYGNSQSRLNIGSGGDISFYDTSGNAKFFWDASAESLGIGTTSPAFGLSVESDNSSGYAALFRKSSSDPALTIQTTSGITQIQGLNSALNATNDIAMQLSGGRVGIGTPSIDSDSILHLKSTQPNIYFEDTDDSKSWRLSAGSVVNLVNVTTGNEAFRVDQSGNFLVGTTTINGVGGSSTPEGVVLDGNNAQITVGTSSDVCATFNRQTTDGAIVQFRKDGTTVGSIGTLGGDVYFGSSSGSGSALRFDGTNNLIYASNASGSARDAALNLGSSSVRFKDLYLSGVARLGTFNTYATIEGKSSSDLEIIANAGQVNANPNIIFKSSNAGSAVTERMRIDSSGALGLGTTPPTTNSHNQIFMGTEAVLLGSSGGALDIGTNLYYNSGWKHRTTGVGAILDFSATGNFVFYNIPSASADAAATFNEAMRINSSGNLLIGKDDDDATTDGIQARGIGSISIARSSVAGDALLILNKKTNDGTIAELRKDGTTVGSIASSGGGVHFNGVGLGLRMSGTAITPTDGGTGTEDATNDLGTSAARFKDLYLSGRARAAGSTGFPAFASVTDTDTGMNPDGAGNIQFSLQGAEVARFDGDGLKMASGRGIKFDAYASGNVLDDYEEGTWTPTLTSFTGSYAVRVGRYTKIGDIVIAEFHIDVNGAGGSGNLQMSGLPFNEGNVSNTYGGVTTMHCNVWSTSTKPDGGLIPFNTSYVNFYKSSGQTGIVTPQLSDLGTGNFLGVLVYKT